MREILFIEIIKRFYNSGKNKIYLLILFSLIAALFEYMGLILIFQFVLFLSNPETIYCKKIIDFFNNYLNINDYPKITLILGVLIASIYIFKNIYMLIFTKFNNEILQDLSVKMTIKTMKNILFQDYLKVNSTTIEQKVNVLSKISLVVWQYCYKVINFIINFAIMLILLSYLYIKFTLPAIVATIFMSALAFVEYKYLKKNSTFQNKHFTTCFDEMNSILLKVISSIKEIKLNNKQQYFIDKIEQKSKDYACLNKNRSFCDIFHIYFTEISVMFSFILVLCALFYTTNFDNQLLITSISTICVIILRLTPVINRMQSCMYAINSNRTLVMELIKFDDSFEKDFDFSTTDEKLEFKKSIELKNIFFKYKNENKGLKDINLKINKGDFIGIVGKSGCYKTTLSLIISSLIKANSGYVIVDDKKLNDNDFKKWQNNISLLGQDYTILADDVSEINSEYLDELGLLDINSKIRELSYGQKQRIALANILSKDKDILILDEISSSSDVVSEDKINKILENLKGKKTIISIAHRLQILKNCDKIVYMDCGEIIDIGTFRELSDKYDDFKKIIELSNFEI